MIAMPPKLLEQTIEEAPLPMDGLKENPTEARNSALIGRPGIKGRTYQSGPKRTQVLDVH